MRALSGFETQMVAAGDGEVLIYSSLLIVLGLGTALGVCALADTSFIVSTSIAIACVAGFLILGNA